MGNTNNINLLSIAQPVRALSSTPYLITLGLHPAGGTRWANYIFLSASPSPSRFQSTCRSTTWLISFLPQSTTSASLSPPLLLTPPLLLPLLEPPLPLCLHPPPPPSPLVLSTPPVWTSPLKRRVSQWSWWRRGAAAWHWRPSWAPCSLCQSWRCWWCTWAGACSSTSPAATHWRSTCSTPHPSLWMSFTRRSSRCGRARPRRTKTTRRRKTGREERGVRRQGGVRSTPQRRTCGSWRRVEGEVWQTLGGARGPQKWSCMDEKGHVTQRGAWQSKRWRRGQVCELIKAAGHPSQLS